LPDIPKPRPVFYLSDRTGITAKTLGHTLLTQFPDIEFEPFTLPFINSVEKATNAVTIINDAAQRSDSRPLVFDTLIDKDIKMIVSACDGMIIDLFDAFIAPLEKELGADSSRTAGLSHGIANDDDYLGRMDALNYSLTNDDGKSTRRYDKADVILIGASRCGKTPSCLYLALQYGVHAANYPLTDQDLLSEKLPEALRPYRDKIIGLTIDPHRLHRIREKRRPGSDYASLAQCKKEITAVESMYQNEGLNYLDASSMSVEEIASTIMHLRE